MNTLEGRLGAVLFCSTLLAWSYFFHFHDRWPNPNETTRLYSAISMAEGRGLSINEQIDRYGVIWDRAERDGRLYSDKAPGLSFAAVPALAVLHLAGKVAGRPPSLAAKHWVARFFAVILPSSLFILLLFVYLRRFLADPYLRAGLLFIYAHGTVAATFSTLFFGHQLSAVLLFTAFCLLDDGGRDGGLSWRAALAGLMLGFAAITEYPTAPAGALVFMYALATWKRREPLAFTVLAGLIPVAAWLVYNKICFGSPFSVGYSHLDSAEFSQVHARGFLGVTLPSLTSFAGTFLGPQRGLLFFSPVCVFGFAGLFALWKSGSRRHALLVAALILAYAYITSAFGYWIGGDVVGPRHLTPLIPFLLMPMAAFLGRSVGEGSVWKTSAFVAAGAVSVVMTTASTIPFPFFPTPFVNPFRDLALAYWEKGIFPYNMGRLLGLKGIYSAAPYLLFFFALGFAALMWLAHKPHAGSGGRSFPWRRGVLARALLPVCLWFAVVVNIVPSQFSAESEAERARELAQFDPAGEDMASLRLKALRENTAPGVLDGTAYAASGKTLEALENYRWRMKKSGR
jgi:hypothetical protein